MWRPARQFQLAGIDNEVQHTFQNKNLPRGLEVTVEWTITLATFKQETRVCVLFLTAHHLSFPKPTPVGFVLGLHYIIKKI